MSAPGTKSTRWSRTSPSARWSLRRNANRSQVSLDFLNFLMYQEFRISEFPPKDSNVYISMHCTSINSKIPANDPD